MLLLDLEEVTVLIPLPLPLSNHMGEVASCCKPGVGLQVGDISVTESEPDGVVLLYIGHPIGAGVAGTPLYITQSTASIKAVKKAQFLASSHLHSPPGSSWKTSAGCVEYVLFVLWENEMSM